MNEAIWFPQSETLNVVRVVRKGLEFESKDTIIYEQLKNQCDQYERWIKEDTIK